MKEYYNTIGSSYLPKNSHSRYAMVIRIVETDRRLDRQKVSLTSNIQEVRGNNESTIYIYIYIYMYIYRNKETHGIS